MKNAFEAAELLNNCNYIEQGMYIYKKKNMLSSK